jgi:hypothetical protein
MFKNKSGGGPSPPGTAPSPKNLLATVATPQSLPSSAEAPAKLQEVSRLLRALEALWGCLVRL